MPAAMLMRALLAAALGLAAAQLGTVGSSFGSYSPANDVSNHAKISWDVADMNALLGKSPPDYAGAKAIYTNGKNSPKTLPTMRTLQGFAQTDLTGKPFYDANKAFYTGTTNTQDAFVLAALDGTSYFAGKSDPLRVESIKKGIQAIILMYSFDKELKSAIAGDSTKNWDEFVAFTYGGNVTSMKNVPYGTATKRDADFGTSTATKIMTASVEGLAAVTAGDKTTGEAKYKELVRLYTIVYMQGTLKYAYKLQATELHASGDAQESWAEGYAFWRAIAGHVAAVPTLGLQAATKIETALKVDQAKPAVGIAGNIYCQVKANLESLYSTLGINAAEVSQLSGMIAEKSACAMGEDYEEVTHPHVEHEEYEDVPVPGAAPATPGATPAPGATPTAKSAARPLMAGAAFAAALLLAI